jgi:hypothetical protein
MPGRHPTTSARSARPSHPDDLFVDQAAHGGMWRLGYLPRSVLGLAALTGVPAALRPRQPGLTTVS